MLWAYHTQWLPCTWVNEVLQGRTKEKVCAESKWVAKTDYWFEVQKKGKVNYILLTEMLGQLTPVTIMLVSSSVFSLREVDCHGVPFFLISTFVVAICQM